MTGPNGKAATEVSVSINCQQLIYETVGGEIDAKVNFFIRLRSNDRSVDGFTEGTEKFAATADELKDAASCRPKVIRKLFELPNGTYRVDVVVRDINAGGHGVKHLAFKVQDYAATLGQ